MMSYAINRQIRPEVGKETLSLAIAGDTCPRGTAARVRHFPADGAHGGRPFARTRKKRVKLI